MVKVVGIGPGSIRHLTVEAKETIESARDIVSFGRVGESLSSLNPNIKSIKRVDELIEMLSESTVILASGDPCFYGITEYLLKKDIEIDEVLTGVSSLQYIMSRLKRGYQNITSLSFHGRIFDIGLFEKGKEYFVLTDGENTPEKISKSLYSAGFRGSMVVGENLSYSDEAIEYKKIGDSTDVGKLSVVVLKIEMD